MKIQGNTILVTGGGTGIGRGLAQEFHDLGNTVVVAGRRRAALEETIAGREDMHAIEIDIADPGSIASVAAQVIRDFPALNVLVNNAGMMRYESLRAGRDMAATEQTIITNLLGPIRLINALTDHLKAQPDAAIINVTSGLGFVPCPGAPAYSATKAALHSYTLSLRAQLGGLIEVIEVPPPAVQTDLTPGQSTREGYMPLRVYVDETMKLFTEGSTPSEILVEEVKPLRFAEANGDFEEQLAFLSQLPAY